VGLAVRGARRMGEKAERIRDGVELARVKTQAAQVSRKSMAAGLVMTVVALLF
jgi:hypothetical protein